MYVFVPFERFRRSRVFDYLMISKYQEVLWHNGHFTYWHSSGPGLEITCLICSFMTLFFFQKVLVAHGAAKVSAYVTHGVFPRRSWERFTQKNDGRYFHILISLSFSQLVLSWLVFDSIFVEGSEKGFAFFWITDSCPHTVKAIGNTAPFEVLSLAGSIADALQI